MEFSRIVPMCDFKRWHFMALHCRVHDLNFSLCSYRNHLRQLYVYFLRFLKPKI